MSDVNGTHEHPLYTWLKSKTTPKDIHWNFGTYFLVDRSGEQVTRYDKISPKNLDGDIQKLIAAKADANL